MELDELVPEFARAFAAADSLSPQATSLRSGKSYQAGIGPHGENAAVRLVLAQMISARPGKYDSARPVPYPSSRLACDLGIGEPLEWAIEVKMVRAFGDNGKPDDTYLHEVLSPYEGDHSAFSDASKLRSSSFACRKAVLIYGFDYDKRPLEPALHALEVLMRERGSIGPRCEAAFIDLIHPVHRRGKVVAWEIL
jgi:hypothetical protein